MKFELFVACRYLFARRKQAFISLISLISTLGVMVGVMALIIALGLMTGLQGELRDKILGATAHIYVFKTGGLADYGAEVNRLKAVSGVTGAGPAVLGRALAVAGNEQAFISLKGIDPALEPEVTDIQRSMVEGSVQALSNDAQAEVPGILIGRELARTLGVPGQPLAVGDSITIQTPQGTLTPMGMLPRTRRLRIAGIYNLGYFEFDSQYGVISLELAQRLMGRMEPDLIELKVSDIYDAPRIADQISQQFGGEYQAQDWTDINGSLFSALWLEKVAIGITIGLIVTVAALNIVASLILLVMEKGKDIAILKTMGTSSRRVMAIFIVQGLMIGLVGTAVGSIGGLMVCWVLNRYQLIRIPSDVYQVSYVPFIVEAQDFFIVVTAAIVICFLATVYPSRQASKLDPVEALRGE
jgi:lipoprotein-releasing system permease protein